MPGWTVQHHRSPGAVELMLTIAGAGRLVTGGVDTHAEIHVAGVADQAGRILGTKEFPATAEGYAAALVWMRGHASN